MTHTYITTPIYYVNDRPHIGHAYTTIAADVLARFHRLNGDEVKFLTGTDEHGQKVAKSAAAKGVEPQDFCDEVSQSFRALVNGGDNLLNTTNDDFIRTTEPRHQKAAQAFWQRIQDKTPDAIYKDTYGGWYAIRDEAYYQENELIERNGQKIAPTGAEVEWVEEESYFFRLSAYADKLLAYYRAHPEFIYPESRANEVISFVEGGLKDLSISRTTFDWGVPVPGDDAHVMYVWIDALTNYLTAAGFPDDAEALDGFWGRDKQGNAVHLVGKDILRFHAVYWPAFLMAAELSLPKQIVAHGWWTIEGEKMSKSVGNVLSPQDMIAKAGGVDQLRYFMLRAMPFGNDGDFAQERMVETVNADLANNIGNLAQRCLTMIQKNCDGKVPAAPQGEQWPLIEGVDAHIDRYLCALPAREYHVATHAITAISGLANEYFAANAPWSLKKEGKLAEMEQVLYVAAETLRIIGILLQPFCPVAAETLLDQLKVPVGWRQFVYLSAEAALQTGAELPQSRPIFPRI